jgi:hypothetical protein
LREGRLEQAAGDQIAPTGPLGAQNLDQIAGLVKGLKAAGNAKMSMNNQKPLPPPPPTPHGGFTMLLKTRGLKKKGSYYPTISMIMNGLITSIRNVIVYFQYHSLLKSPGIASKSDLTHDVYGQKGVSPKTGKAAVLSSIGYRQETDGFFATFCAKPTMCLLDKGLSANRYSPAISYVIENKPRSHLALKSNLSRTHDVYEAKRLTLKRCLFDLSRAFRIASLCVASRLVIATFDGEAQSSFAQFLLVSRLRGSLSCWVDRPTLIEVARAC